MTHLPAPIIISDIISEVVAKVNTDWLTVPGNTPIYFYHDTPIIWQNTLDGKTKAGKPKFPCIVLFHEYPEQWGAKIEYPGVRIPKIGIAAMTLPELTGDQRYDKTFRPILYPLYQLFKLWLARHPLIVAQDDDVIQHTKTDCLYWGVIGKVTNDYLDAIEMENTILYFQQNC